MDNVLGTVLRYFYFKQEVGKYYRATYSIERSTEKILIFGSSRAYHHYVPEIISKQKNLSCHNLGSPGLFIIYNYAVLQSVLKRYTPEFIILDISPGEFQKQENTLDRLSFLLPYFKDHPEIHSIVNLRSPYEKYKLVSKIYPYNSSFLMILAGNLNYFKKKKKDQMGFVALTNTWTELLQENDFTDYSIDTLNTDMLRSFIRLCKENRITLRIICSPSFIKYKEEDNSINLASQIASEYNVMFLDFSNNPFFLSDKTLFNDPMHLNLKGALKFSEMLCSDSLFISP